MKKYTAKIGMFIVGLSLFVALFAPWVAPHSPYDYNLKASFATPCRAHLLGNDSDGRDILSRILYGASFSLGISLSVVFVSLVVGSSVGVVAGFYGGIADKIFVFVTDVFLAFPGFLLAIAIAAFLETSVANVIVILCVKGWVTYARLTRGQTLVLKEKEFVLASRAIGVGRMRLFFRHLLPNMAGPLIVNASFGMAGVIMIESSLSFLGLGVPVDAPSWGAMLDQGTRYLLVAPHLSIFPGIAIMLVVMGFNFLGDGLRDRLAPRGR